jgi:KDO2-lipid IV(A) lauroyltransferase
MKSSDFVASYLRASAFDRVSASFLRGILFAMKNQSLSGARKWGKTIGDLSYFLDRHWKPKALERLISLLHPPDPDRILRNLYEHYGMILSELAHVHTISYHWRSFFEYDGVEHTKELAQGGVLVTAHLGNWEIFAVGHVRRFGPLAALVKPIRNAYLHHWINRLRTSLGVLPIITRSEAFTILKHLHSSGRIVVLLDQNSLRDEGVFTRFFGRLACTHYGPILLAIRAGVPILSGFGIRTPEGKFQIFYEPPVEIPKGDLHEKVYLVTQELTTRIENWVKRYPDQWFWVHDRFRTQPTEDTPSWKLPPLQAESLSSISQNI